MYLEIFAKSELLWETEFLAYLFDAFFTFFEALLAAFGADLAFLAAFAASMLVLIAFFMFFSSCDTSHSLAF